MSVSNSDTTPGRPFVPMVRRYVDHLASDVSLPVLNPLLVNLG